VLSIAGERPGGGLSPTSSLLRRRDDARRRRAPHSKRRDHLRPDRNHAQKQRQRGQCGGFFNNGADHVTYSPRRERAVNIVRVMFYVKPAVARAFQLWRAGLLTRRRSCHNILRLSAKARCAETSGCLTPVPRSEAPPAPSVLLPYVAWPHSLIEQFVGGRLHDSFGLLSFAHGDPFANQLHGPCLVRLVRMFHPAAIAPLCAAAVAGRWRAVCSGLNPARPRARP
jgi:hypothetical protein